MDLLLYPHSQGGICNAAVFQAGAGAGPNWTTHFVCGETWWAPSWNNVPPDQPWASMLANHLKAVE